jgi:hypothetical protein
MHCSYSVSWCVIRCFHFSSPSHSRSEVKWSSERYTIWSFLSSNSSTMSALQFVVVLLAMICIIDAELICPGFGFIRPQQPCVDSCSTSNDTCAAGQKCCYTPIAPCGYRCQVGKDNKPKPGSCPSSQSEQTISNWYLCDANLCDVDSDCSCRKKCCANKCGSKVCIKPLKKIAA